MVSKICSTLGLLAILDLYDHENYIRHGLKKQFPGCSDSKESACNVEDSGSIPGSGSTVGEGNGYPLQYSCLKNSKDRGAWQATVHGVAKSWTQLSD